MSESQPLTSENTGDFPWYYNILSILDWYIYGCMECQCMQIFKCKEFDTRSFLWVRGFEDVESYQNGLIRAHNLYIDNFPCLGKYVWPISGWFFLPVYFVLCLLLTFNYLIMIFGIVLFLILNTVTFKYCLRLFFLCTNNINVHRIIAILYLSISSIIFIIFSISTTATGGMTVTAAS
eukprot:TRINITY_DN2_c3_g1_i1.p1 TRINITY_DN2_c3_g1~~TRINITY_DN2_c3_g1_i1.p1  ORF type:complete len:178 (+),score=6.93 TRINITY_DN2_c3_g1_i1:90-623(+)